MSQALPYSESFNQPDGSPWPNWQSPGPNGNSSAPCDVQGGRGRISLPAGRHGQFNARIDTDDAPTYDLSFQFDLSEIVLSQSASECWLQVQMGGPNSVLTGGDGSTFYQLYLDTVDGLQAALYVYGATTDYVTLPSLSPSQPISLRMVESGTSRGFKIWQGAEPAEFTLTLTTVPHTGPRFIDLLFEGNDYAGAPHVYFDNITAGAVPLPYYEPFNYADGSAWPLWQSPGPNWADSNPIDVNQSRGRVQFADRNVGSNYFNARLYTADAPVYDLKFDFDFSEMVAALTNDIFDPNLYCFVRMMDFGEQVAYYQIYYDLFDGLQVSITKSTMRDNFDWQDDFNYEIVAGIDMSRPVSVHIQESGTDHRLKVWQAGAAEPPEWTQTVTGAVHTGPRYIDLNMNARYVGTPSIYFDNISVNAGNNVLSDTGNDSRPLPYIEPFNYPDGGDWFANGGWAIPGPLSVADMLGGRGRIHQAPGSSHFSAGMPIDNAAVIDFRVTIDINEMLNATQGPFKFRVQLEDAADGTDFYELFYDPYDDAAHAFQVAIYKWSHPSSAGGQAFASPTGSGYVVMDSINHAELIYVRIQETGTDRYLKVWQGDEPGAWTIHDAAAPQHGSGQRNIDLSTFAEIRPGGPPAYIYLDDLSVNRNLPPGPGKLPTYIEVGSTVHFNYWYDTALGSKGATDATTAMGYAEHDLLNHFGWFGSTGPWSNGVERVDVIFDGPGHYEIPANQALAFYRADTGQIHFNWKEPTPNVELDTAHEYRAVWIHEVVHHFQHLQGAGHFFDSRSMTEAHAAFLERLFRRDIGDWAALKMGGYAQHVQTWLNSNREDWVNYTVPFDSDAAVFNEAVGCTLLFFNWLHFMHGYSGAQITQAGGNTPRAIYRNLSGNSADPFPGFYNELEREFDPAYQLDLRNYPDIANVYPLTPAKQAASPPQNTVGNGLIALQQQLVRQQLRQNLRRF